MEIVIKTKGDTKVEADETMNLVITSPVNASIGDGVGVGTIQNDDGGVTPPPPPPGSPVLSIGSVQDFETDSGTHQYAFAVTLDKASTKTVTVRYATHNQTAGEGDYTPVSGTLTFAAGQKERFVNVTIKGDTKPEANETFRVELSSPVNATIGNGAGIGTILNDD
jgi:hypothetical protein